MKQKFKQLGLLAALLLASLQAAAYDFEVDGIYYTVISLPDLTCEVSSPVYSREHISIPNSVDFKGRTLTVIRIGDNAFEDCKILTSISLPTNLIEIGEKAFKNCTSLQSISFPESLTKIEDYAFYNCVKISSIVLPESLSTIGDYVFQRCISLSTFSFPESFNYIGIGMFKDCSSLTSVSLPTSMTGISPEAFRGCASLSSINLPESLTAIGRFAFCDCNLEKLSLPDSLKYIKLGAFLGASIQEINLPTNLEEIEITERLPFGYSGDSYYLFQGCKNLKTLKIEVDWKKLKVEIPSWNNWNLTEDNDPKVILNKDIQKTVENLTLEHNFKHISFFNNIKRLVLGEKVDSISNINPSTLPTTLNEIVCYSTIPPTVKNCEFLNTHYLNTILRVPQGSLKAYKNYEPWKNFWDIQGFDPAGIEDVKQTTELTEIARYDLYGRSVSDDYEGIVIIRYSDGSSKKVLNKNI